MDYRKAMVPILILLLLSPAFAAITVTMNSPATGRLYQPNLVSADQSVTFDFNILDSNGENSIHTATLMYDFGDNNTAIFADLNLTPDNCDFVNDNDWNTNGGARCIVNYTWRTHAPTTAVAGYVFDLNVRGGTTASPATAIGEKVIVLGLDNRFIDAATEAMLNVIATVLIAAVIVMAALAFLGKLDGTTVITVAMVGVTAVVVVIVLTIVIGILTP